MFWIGILLQIGVEAPASHFHRGQLHGIGRGDDMPLTNLHHDVMTDSAPHTSARSNRFWTIPNVLSGTRLIGSFAIVGCALAERPIVVLVLFIVLEMTDWFDGRLAIALNQRTTFGARLDSAADVTLATAALFAGLWLHWTALQAELVWIGSAIGTYWISSIFGLIKFRQVPAYHTFAAKKCWGLITIGVVCLFAEWHLWPLRVALIAVTLTNLEAISITAALRAPRVDVTSLWHLLRSKDQTEGFPTQGEDP